MSATELYQTKLTEKRRNWGFTGLILPHGLSVAGEQEIDDRCHDQAEQHGHGESADDGDGQRLQHLRAGAEREGQRQHFRRLRRSRSSTMAAAAVVPHASWNPSRSRPRARNFFVRIQQQNAVFGHDAITMIRPMNEATLNVVRVISRARITPDMESTERGKNGDGRGEVAELGEQHAEDQRQRQQQHSQQVMEGLLLLFVGASVFDAHRRGTMQPGDRRPEPWPSRLPRSDPSRRPVTTTSRSDSLAGLHSAAATARLRPMTQGRNVARAGC